MRQDKMVDKRPILSILLPKSYSRYQY